MIENLHVVREVPNLDPDIPYLLLTPGPLTPSHSVRQAMQRDDCTWDVDYCSLVNEVRERLVGLATHSEDYTSVLMQGSGTFSVEATVGTAVPSSGRFLVVDNGAYGRRIGEIAERLKIDSQVLVHAETEPADPQRVAEALAADPAITHVALVHCETTTGLLNPIEAVGAVVREYGRQFIVDVMSSFGGIPLLAEALPADYLVFSANKCLQGVPGFGCVVARRASLSACRDQARSLSLDLYDQWQVMEQTPGKWRYTSPTHVVRALRQALRELDDEGGVAARHSRYTANQRLLVDELEQLGFRTLLPRELQSPIITSFRYPEDPRFQFTTFLAELKRRRFMIYPGKVTGADTFRIGTIGHVFAEDIRELVAAIAEVIDEQQWQL